MVKQQMDEAQEAYRQCLVQNIQDVSHCESQRVIYEAARDKWHESQGTSPSSGEFDKPRTWVVNQSGHSLLCNDYSGAVNCH
jgi:hypothetical protein